MCSRACVYAREKQRQHMFSPFLVHIGLTCLIRPLKSIAWNGSRESTYLSDSFLSRIPGQTTLPCSHDGHVICSHDGNSANELAVMRTHIGIQCDCVGANPPVCVVAVGATHRKIPNFDLSVAAKVVTTILIIVWRSLPGIRDCQHCREI